MKQLTKTIHNKLGLRMGCDTIVVVAKRCVKYLVGLVVLILLLLTFACETLEVYPLCRNYTEFHNSTMVDLTTLPTRVAYGRLHDIHHVQLQVYYNKRWRWVIQYPYKVVITLGEKDLGFEVDEYGSMEEAKKKRWIK